jgi:hypothetical protein
MHDELSSSQTSYLTPWTPHSYSPVMWLFGGLILVAALYAVVYFPYVELTCHQVLHARIQHAGTFFRRSEFIKAAELYKEIITDYPSYKPGKIALAQCFFALSQQELAADKEDDEDQLGLELYIAGIMVLSGETFESREQKELLRYVPADFQEGFLEGFTTVKER